MPDCGPGVEKNESKETMPHLAPRGGRFDWVRTSILARAGSHPEISLYRDDPTSTEVTIALPDVPRDPCGAG